MQVHADIDSRDGCFFCDAINGSKAAIHIIPDLELGPFVAVYDQNPVTPGHILIIPKRHIQYMKDLRRDEGLGLFRAVVEVKQYLLTADLRKIYILMSRSSDLAPRSKAYTTHCLESLAKYNRPPDSFNDGVNDGPAAGQTIPHFHWHIMPRWQSDMVDPRGGVRHMFAGLGNYKLGVARPS